MSKTEFGRLTAAALALAIGITGIEAALWFMSAH
jgi:hypothetical protein